MADRIVLGNRDRLAEAKALIKAVLKELLKSEPKDELIDKALSCIFITDKVSRTSLDTMVLNAKKAGFLAETIAAGISFFIPSTPFPPKARGRRGAIEAHFVDPRNPFGAKAGLQTVIGSEDDRRIDPKVGEVVRPTIFLAFFAFFVLVMIPMRLAGKVARDGTGGPCHAQVYQAEALAGKESKKSLTALFRLILSSAKSRAGSIGPGLSEITSVGELSVA